MNIKFEYNNKKDAWCILNFGKTSNNSDYITEMYKILELNNSLDQSSAENFVLDYIKEKNLSVTDYIKTYNIKFESIKEDFIKVAERTSGVSIDYEITAYLTLNQRYPYGISERLFFVPFPGEVDKISNLTIMHELWHFYTWEKFKESESKIGSEKYNIIKESLTVLLNIECKDFLLINEVDNGYPHHADLRSYILDWWKENQDIDFVWNKSVDFLNK